MIALDTCVLARLILGDDPVQQELASQYVRENDCSVSWSVLVELCWVLERSARLPKAKVLAAFDLLREIDGISLPSDEGFDWVVARYEAGADFADMVHLITANSGSLAFATFDRKLERQAGRSAPNPVVTIAA